MKFMKITEILQTVESSVDFGTVFESASYDPDFNHAMDKDAMRTLFWKMVISTKASDTGFGHLVHSILESGWRGDSTIGWDDDFKQITEGHHRLVAAILMGMDTVPVTVFGSGFYDDVSGHNPPAGAEDFPVLVEL